MHHPHHDAVVQLMRRVAAEIVLPRFRNLAADEVEEKAADDMVTIADRLSEEALTAGLVAIDASARVVGEEAVAADATLLDGIDQGRVWIVDPIDGTNNYASGKTPFGIMIALAEEGEVLAGWILDPVADRLCHTVAGGGAFIDDVAVTARPRTDERPYWACRPISSTVWSRPIWRPGRATTGRCTRCRAVRRSNIRGWCWGGRCRHLPALAALGSCRRRAIPYRSGRCGASAEWQPLPYRRSPRRDDRGGERGDVGAGGGLVREDA